MRTRLPAATSGAAAFTPPGPDPTMMTSGEGGSLTRTPGLPPCARRGRRAPMGVARYARSRPPSPWFPQRALVDLEVGRQRQLGQQREPVGPLEGRELGADERAQLGEGRWIAGHPRLDVCPAELAQPLVRHAHDC